MPAVVPAAREMGVNYTVQFTPASEKVNSLVYTVQVLYSLRRALRAAPRESVDQASPDMAQSEQKREQIVEAAVDEFQQRGFAGASMDRVAEAANVSKRTVYNHFESKEALFRAILDVLFEEVSATIDVRFDPAQPLRPQLVDLGRAEGRLLRSRRFIKMIRLALAETIRDPVLAAEVNARVEAISAFDDFMRAAADAGALNTDDASEASEQFMGLIKSRTFWPSVMSGQTVNADQMESIIQSTVETFMLRFGGATD